MLLVCHLEAILCFVKCSLMEEYNASVSFSNAQPDIADFNDGVSGVLLAMYASTWMVVSGLCLLLETALGLVRIMKPF